MRARSSSLSVQGVWWGINLRARSYTLSVQGVQTKQRSAEPLTFYYIPSLQHDATLAGSAHTHARLPFGKSCATSASQLVTSCATFATCFTAQNGSATSAS